MLTVLGVLVITIAITGFVWNSIKREKDAEDVEIKKYNDRLSDEKNGWRNERSLTNMMPFPSRIKPALLLVIGICIFGLNGMFFWANSGTAYAVQYPWGGDKMVKTQGLKTKMWGRTIPLSFEISIQDQILKVDQDGDKERLAESSDGIYNREASLWEFSDAIKAEIGIAVVVGVNTDDEEVFLDMADRNRSESKLIYGRVLPNIDAALKNTCKLMDAQEYISGKSSDFDRYFRDQLENGMYLVEEYYEAERKTEIIGDTNTVRSIQPERSSKQKRFRIKRDAQGNIVRDNKSNTLKQYGIKIYQAQVTAIDWEESFDKRLDLQKNEVAQTQLEKQQAERQYYTAKKEIAKGEAEKAAERAKLEKEQIKLTIAAETEAKVAEQNVIAEKKKLEVAKLQALSKKVSADATYYENSKLVSAGLTPQEKAELELKKATAVAAEFAKMVGPQVVIMGQDGKNGSGNLTNSLIQAEMAKKLINKD
jgi:regulator of protease activity HflC (stomatin/prohibitin superfamily)